MLTLTKKIKNGGFKDKIFSCNYMFKVDNRNTRARGEICSKLTMASSGIFIVTL